MLFVQSESAWRPLLAVVAAHPTAEQATMTGSPNRPSEQRATRAKPGTTAALVPPSARSRSRGRLKGRGARLAASGLA